jgi:hypothetical protein
MSIFSSQIWSQKVQIRILNTGRNFQENDRKLSLSTEQLDIGLLLLHFMRIAFFNSHEVRKFSKHKS